MKAKVYYIHPDRLVDDIAGVKLTSKKPHQLALWSRPDYPVMGVEIPIYVLPASSLDKVIEKAAKGMYEHNARQAKIGAHIGPIGYPKPYTWRKAGKGHRSIWLALARAAYEAGGFKS